MNDCGECRGWPGCDDGCERVSKVDDVFEIVREKFLSMQVCSNIPPERMDELDSLVNRSTLSGTVNGWKLDRDIQPVKCADKKGFWHYIFVC